MDGWINLDQEVSADLMETETVMLSFSYSKPPNIKKMQFDVARNAASISLCYCMSLFRLILHSRIITTCFYSVMECDVKCYKVKYLEGPVYHFCGSVPADSLFSP